MDTHQQNREGLGVDRTQEEEDIQQNIQDISKKGDLSPRSVSDLKKDRRKGKTIGTKKSQIQTRNSSTKSSGGK